MIDSTPVRLSPREIGALEPYAFLAVLGKRVIHPGGRQSTEEMYRLGDFQATQRVLDVGCGVATTGIEIATRFGADVTAVDVSSLMLERARRNVRESDVAGKVTVQEGDILALPFPESTFDRVVAEAVTMFVDRRKAARGLGRVCR